MFGKKKMEEADSMKALKGATLQNVLMGLLFVLLGVFLVLNPKGVARTICFSIGSVVLLIGVANLVIYFVSDVKHNLPKNKFIIGVILVILGLFFIIGYRAIMEIMSRIMGVMIIFNGVMKLQSALDAMKMKAKGWAVLLLISVVTLLIGAAFLIFSFGSAKLVLRIVGLLLIAIGVSDLVSVLYIRKRLGEYLQDRDALIQDAKEI